ncbi:MAG: UDP-N-acetylmuramoyl-L-alanine--D-glutamate ligase [Christensenellales bacterium]
MPEKFKKVLVFGDGVSGKGAYAALEKKGINCVLRTESDYADDKNNYDAVVVSPGVKPDHPIFKRYAGKIISEIDLGAIFATKPYFAVTGTNGKTTTVELAGRLLSVKYKTCVTGNIGRSFAFDSLSDSDAFVVEASSFQLCNSKYFAPHVAVILNITPDHLDYHGDTYAYAKAKLNIAAKQTENDFLILSADDLPVGLLGDFFRDPKSFIRRFAVKRRRVSRKRQDLLARRKVCSRLDVPLKGLHNVSDALAAIAIAKIAGVSNDEIVSSLAGYEPGKHRLKYVCAVRGVAFYDDSKGTNVAATLKAMDSMTGSYALIAGGATKVTSTTNFLPVFRASAKSVCDRRNGG